MFEIHPNAEKNFNNKLSKLIKNIKEIPHETHLNKSPETDIHVSQVINKSDIIGELQETESDYLGNTVARFFTVDKNRYGLSGEGYSELVSISEKIQRLPTFRDRVSKRFIEKEAFNWIKNAFLSNSADSFITTLIERAKEAVKPVTIFVPIADTIVQSSFEFCGVEICSISKDMVDDYARFGDSLKYEEQKSAFMSHVNEFRSKYQGYASVKIILVCEQQFADDLAIEKAKRVTDFLGIFSGASLVPNIKCTSTIKGYENLVTATTFSQYSFGKKSFNFSQKCIGTVSLRKITDSELEKYNSCGLGILSMIAIKEKTTDFENLILNTSLLYSKVAFTSEPIEKLVYVLSALESTLLKNESEPIQQNLAERLAIFISDELQERKLIIKNAKFVYGLRSRYLHHGHSSGELEEISMFLFNTWIFYVRLLGVSHLFKDKEEFLEAIDDQKLG